MSKKLRIAYLTVGENLDVPLQRRQVLEMLCELTRQAPELDITLFSVLPLHAMVKHRAGLLNIRKTVESCDIRFRVIPSLVPWPLPHIGFYKTDVGYRPKTVWTRLAAWLLAFQLLPTVAYFYYARKVRIFHCRSYPAAFAVSILKVLLPSLKLIFDPRSDFPEENVTAGNWNYGDRNFLFWKAAERRILQKADAVACIAPSYLREYHAAAGPTIPGFLVPNNVDIQAFAADIKCRRELREKLAIGDDELVFCYLGTMTSGGWNCAEVYARACRAIADVRSNCRFLFIVPASSSGLLERALAEQGLSCKVAIVSPDFAATPKYLSVADYGIMFMHRKTVRVGTKVGEYLAAGLPILANANCIGAADLIAEKQVGYLLNLGLGDLDSTIDSRALATLEQGNTLEAWRHRLSAFAQSYFGNATIAREYIQQYKKLR